MAEAVAPPPDDGDLPPLQTPVVVEDASGQQFDADATELDALIRSGQYKLAPDQYQQGGAGGVPVTVGGETRYLPADQADAAIRSFEGDATIAAAVEQEEERRYYQSPLQKARTVAAGGLRGLIPFGASDQALVALKPELADELAKFKAYNPELNTAAEIGGMALPFLAGGAGAVGGGLRAAGAGVRGVAAGAEMAGAGVTRALGGGALARGAGAAVRGGLDVGAFEAGQEISAAALEKREIDAAKVASAFGHGALVGAATMGIGSLAWSGGGAVLGKAGEMARGAATAVGEKVSSLASSSGEGFVQQMAKRLEAEMGAKSVGALKSQMREFYGDSFVKSGAQGRAVEMAQEMALKSAEEKLVLATSAAKKAGAEIGAAIDQLSAAGARADTAALGQGIRSQIDDFAKRSGPQYKTAARELETWGEDLAKNVADGDIKKLWQFKKDLGDSTLWPKKPADFANDTIADRAKRRLYHEVNDLISATGEAAGGGFADAWKAANREYQAAQWVEQTLKEKVAANSNRVFGLSEQIGAGAGLVASGGFSPMGILGAAAGAVSQRLIKSYGADMAGLVARGVREGNTQALSQALGRISDTAVGRYLGAAQKAAALPVAQAARQGVVRAEAEISQRLFGDAKAARAPERDAAKPVRLAARTDSRKAAPAPSVRDVRARLEESRDATRARYEAMAAQYPALAPEIAGSLKASERTHAYLLSTLPQSANQKHSLTPQAEQPRLTPQQKADLATRVRVSEDPLSVLASLEAGSLSRVEVEALKATAPEVYEQIRGDVQRQLDGRTEPLPYKKALEISLLLGVVGHPSLDPQAVRALQAAYAPPPPQAQPGPPAGAPKREVSRSKDWSLKGEVA